MNSVAVSRHIWFDASMKSYQTVGPLMPTVRVLLAAPLICAYMAVALAAGACAQASTSATITPFLSPDRLGARASLTLAIHYAGGEFGVPSPVRSSVLQLPAGMSLEIPSLRVCHAAWLRARGSGGCPARSRLGGGHALAETLEGSQIVTENLALWAFLGPPRNLEPTFEVLAQGTTPVQESLVIAGSVISGSAPYGEQLVMSIPPVPTLPLEPDASIVTFSLTVGASHRRTGDRNAVLVPLTCPARGFPFAARFTYADGSGSSALARIPCPA